MIPASELKVLVGVYGIPEANRKLLRFDADLKALASSDPTVTLHAEVDVAGFSEFEALKVAAAEPVTTTLRAEIDDLGFEEAAIKKSIFEDPATTSLGAEIDELGFAEAAAMKDAFEDPVTTHLRAEATGFDTVIAQLDAIRAMAKVPITQEVKLKIDKSSLASLGAADAAIGATNGNGGGEGGGFLGGVLAGSGAGGKGFLPTALWGGHGAGGGGPWWMRAALGGGLLAGAGSLGSFAGFGAEHVLFTGLGVAGSAGAGLLGGGLVGAGALGTMAVGGGSDLAVMKSTITDATELGKKYDSLQQAIALYGAHSKEAAKASAELHLAMSELGPAAKSELAVAKQGESLNQFWDKATADARIQASHILTQVMGLGHSYVPLVAHAADQNLAIIDKDLKPLFHWLEGPEGTGIFEHLEEVFAHNLPTAMHALDQGVQFVLKTLSVASNYTGGFVESVDDFFTKWNEPQNFQKWEGEIGHLVGDFHLWLSLIKQLGVDVYDLFSQDAHTGEGIVRTLDGMLVKLDEWETSTEGKEQLHNLFVVHKQEILELLHLIPLFVSSVAPIYMTVAPFLTETMTEILGDFGDFLKLLDETGPITRWALGLTVIGAKLFGFKALFAPLGKAMWGPFESLLAKDRLIGRFFESQVSETEALTTATEGLTAAVDDLTASYEAMGAAATTAGEEAGAATAVGATGATEAAAGTTVAGGTAAAGGFAGTGIALPVLLIGGGAIGATKMGHEMEKLAGRTSGSHHLLPSVPVLGHVFGGAEEFLGVLGFGGESSHAARTHANRHQQSLGLDWMKSEAELTSLRHHFSDTLGKIHADAGRGLGAIDKALGTGLHQADETWEKGTSQWKGHTAAAMHAAVEAIRAGMKAGTIDVSEGHVRIHEIMIQMGVDAGEFRNEVMGALREANAAALAEASQNPGLKIPKRQRDAIGGEAEVLGRLKSGYVLELEQIKTLLRHGSEELSQAFAKGSPEWREAAADNMHAAIEAIKAGEHEGFITVEKGNKEIAALLHQEHLVSGNDPFGIAHGFVHSWEKAGGANRKGIAAAMSELGAMSKSMRPIVIGMELEQVRHAERAGTLVKGSYNRLRSAVVSEFGVMALKAGEKVASFSGNVEGSFGTLSVSVAEALENMGVNVGALLEHLGAHNPLQSFTLKYLHAHGAPAGSGSKYLNQIAPLGRQEGGFTIPGTVEGDRHPMMLPHGSFIMNREATAAYGLQSGGHVPVLGESGERVFYPHEVAAIGAHNLVAMNSSVKRFQHGGMLGPEPQLQGPQGALLTLGDAAIHTGYAAAQKYLDAHRPKTSSGGAFTLSGATVATPLQFAEYMIQAGFPKTVKVISEGLGTILSESGFKVNNGQGPSGHIGPWAESPAFGSVKVREDPLGSTEAAYRVGWAPSHSFWGAWGQWEAEQSGLAGGGARSYGSQFRATAEEALGLRGGRKPQRTGAAANAHHHGFAEGGLVDVAALRAIARHPGARLTPEQQKAHLAWKWGHRMAEGGLIAAEESRLGVPNSTAASEAKKAQSERESRQTPTEVVHWAMERIGQKSPWDSEYPGEWCGDFLADDFRSHGMPVPSGYAAAANWGSYGTALGRGHMQAGAVIDYDGQHVALAISSSQMIQGNDIHGVVGTSEIVGSVGGSPITAVRWPPYSKGHGPGAGSAPTETVPGTFHGAHTKALSFPGIPNTLHGIAVQIHRWREELQKYEHASHLATGRPKLQHALQANVTRIQKYLRELERARVKLRKEVARKHYSHHLAKQLGKITGEEKNIELAQRAYEVAGQYAEQVVGLEPREPTLQQLPEQAGGESEAAYNAKVRSVEEANHAAELGHLHSYEAFVEGRERPAYLTVLGTEADWRNAILTAESKASRIEAGWETQIHSDDVMIAGIPRHFEHVKRRVEKWNAKHPKADLPRVLGREWQAAQWEMSQLPELRFKDKELRKVLGEARQAFYPGFPKALQPPQPPLPGSGEFEQQMQEVQGIHWPAQHERLAVAALMPPRHAGSFGGAIWDTQTAIEELGLSITQAQGSVGSIASAGVGGAGGGASGPSAAEQEHTQLLEELLKQAREREVVGELERQTLSGAHVLPYAGAYASGGMVSALVGEEGPEIIATRPGSYIHNASETSSILSPKVVVNHYHDEDRTEVEIDDQKVEAIVNQMGRRSARTARRGLARPGF